ncbi:MAG: DUF5611 family protein [bacterium]
MTTRAEFPVRRAHVKRTDLAAVMEEVFGTAKRDGEWVESSFGLIPRIRARYDGGTKLLVVNEQNKGPATDTEMAPRTIKAWNLFLERATGYNAKQRGKKVQQAAKKADAADVPEG